MYYIALLIIILLIGALFSYFKIDLKHNKNILFLIMFILLLFLAFRGENVGLDMGNYRDAFFLIKSNSFKYIISNINFEVGFKLYTKIISLFTGNFRIYVFITSIISMIGPYLFIRNNSKNYYASCFIFLTFSYYIYNFCTLRQSLAISFMLVGYNFLIQGKKPLFVFSILFSFLFHKTSIILLLLVLIDYLPNIKKIFPFYLVGCILLFIFKQPLVTWLTNIFYGQYIGYRDTSGSGYTMLLLIFGFIVYFCIITKMFNIEERENKILVYMLLFSLPFQILSITQGLIARITLYFNYSLILLIPGYFETLKGNSNKYFKVAYYFSLTLFFVYQVYSNSMYVPYSLI